MMNLIVRFRLKS